MNELRFMIIAIFGGFGLYVMILNWYIFWVFGVMKKRNASFAPILAPVSMCIALMALPDKPAIIFWLMPFVIDIDTFYLLFITPAIILIEKYKK